ncbi:TPA: hypothetical protein ACRTTK_003084 [Aeromonas hydrophila]|uniref:hypothetical protein n=1 Tax=Aeromonas hydrophila TaxID=644 RepID=UPI0024433D1F|nr:hypothetical protein [Aeromonas hydrophila]
MLRYSLPRTVADGYTAGIFAALAYHCGKSYLIAALVGLAAMAVFRIQHLVKRCRRKRR